MNKTAKTILQGATSVYNTLKIPGDIARELGVAVGTAAGTVVHKKVVEPVAGYFREADKRADKAYADKNENYAASLAADREKNRLKQNGTNQ